MSEILPATEMTRKIKRLERRVERLTEEVAGLKTLRSPTGVITPHSLAMILHNSADDTGQWSGGDVCEDLAILAAGAMTMCGDCGCAYPKVFAACPYDGNDHS